MSKHMRLRVIVMINLFLLLIGFILLLPQFGYTQLVSTRIDYNFNNPYPLFYSNWGNYSTSFSNGGNYGLLPEMMSGYNDWYNYGASSRQLFSTYDNYYTNWGSYGNPLGQEEATSEYFSLIGSGLDPSTFSSGYYTRSPYPRSSYSDSDFYSFSPYPGFSVSSRLPEEEWERNQQSDEWAWRWPMAGVGYHLESNGRGVSECPVASTIDEDTVMWTWF